jgi:WD40 repeat protein
MTKPNDSAISHLAALLHLHDAEQQLGIEPLRRRDDCPEPSELIQLALGQASREATGRVEEHAAECLYCRTALQSFRSALADEPLPEMPKQADGVDAVAVSGDGHHALSGSGDGALRWWDLQTGACRHVLRGHTDLVSAVALSGDSRHALSGSHDGTLRWWDLQTGSCLHVLEGHAAGVTAVALGGDGRHALSGSHDGTLRWWDLQTGACLHVLQGHTDAVTAVALSGDGRHALSGARDGTLRWWDLQQGACRHVLQGHTSAVNAVAVSRDGCHALSGSHDGTLRWWDLQQGACRHVLQGHTSGVRAVALSRDGCHALSGSWDHTLRWWDLQSGSCLHVLQGHTSGVTAVALSRDGCHALSGSHDGTLRWWDLASASCDKVLLVDDDPMGRWVMGDEPIQRKQDPHPEPVPSVSGDTNVAQGTAFGYTQWFRDSAMWPQLLERLCWLPHLFRLAGLPENLAGEFLATLSTKQPTHGRYSRFSLALVSWVTEFAESKLGARIQPPTEDSIRAAVEAYELEQVLSRPDPAETPELKLFRETAREKCRDLRGFIAFAPSGLEAEDYAGYQEQLVVETLERVQKELADALA